MTTRRYVLASAGALAIGGVAGCVGNGDDETSDSGNGDDNQNGAGNGDAETSDSGNGNDSANGTESGTVSGDGQGAVTTTIETVGTDCAGEQSDIASVEFDEDGLTVSGVTPAPTPCHEAALGLSSLDDDAFSLTVGVESDGSDTCAECTGQVAYEIRLEGGGAGEATEGTVRHIEGETHQLTTDGPSSASGTGDGTASGDAQGGVATTIETVGTDCAGERSDIASVEFDENGLTVSGVTPAPTPCHEAALGLSSLDNDAFSLTVGVESDGSDTCSECTGQVAYEIRLEGGGAGEATAGTVRHVEGETHQLTTENPSSSATGDGTASGDAQGGVATTIETVGTDCAGEQSDIASVEFDENGLTVSGVTPAATPCHEAVLGLSSLDNDAFSLTVGVESDGSDTCSECTGQVAYEIRLEGGGAGEATAGTVRHVEGETHQLTTENPRSENRTLVI